MWDSPDVVSSFGDVTNKVVAGNYEAGLAVANKLLAKLEARDRYYAYVLGCRKAVCLRHLGLQANDAGLLAKAEVAFSEAYEMATVDGDPIITAYIRNDWASMREGDEAAEMVREAIELLTRTPDGLSPDPNRLIVADRAYFQATLAEILYRQGKIGEARSLIATAKEVLQRHAYGGSPRYKANYLIVLGWEFRQEAKLLPGSALRCLRLAPVLIFELLRQRAAIKAIRFVREGYLIR